MSSVDHRHTTEENVSLEGSRENGGVLPTCRLLVLAYHFPRSTAAGVFRTLCFVKYLPEFGWQPMVVTISPDDCGYPCDLALLDQLPKNALVQHTEIRFPDDRITKLARWIRTTGRTAARPGGANGRASNKVDLDDPRPVGRLWQLAAEFERSASQYA